MQPPIKPSFTLYLILAAFTILAFKHYLNNNYTTSKLKDLNQIIDTKNVILLFIGSIVFLYTDQKDYLINIS
jgi:hypothetical protein